MGKPDNTYYLTGRLGPSSRFELAVAAPTLQDAASRFLATIPTTFSDVMLNIKLVPTLEVRK